MINSTNPITIVANHPAVAYYTQDNNVVHDDTEIHIPGVRGQLKFGSVKGYAEKYGLDAKKEEQRAIETGEAAWFVMNLGSCITSHDQPKRWVQQFEFGDEVVFHGKRFELQPARNNNVVLSPLENQGV
jgi:hypothetical protein